MRKTDYVIYMPISISRLKIFGPTMDLIKARKYLGIFAEKKCNELSNEETKRVPDLMTFSV